ncbi:hypothetical protein [Actinoallomurus rhizosphaericola]|uniref:hypothetical protein n=1 Tax=Actinoallomurus rhizosphaericola TaxID=2952536 RepID=UPI002093354B|nr:hypothetical protein [Actinoallomurus rhizosphaericola]MCO5996292.1 hypothetical protein [Actinoallomurus rhizosphaericola]
MALLALGMTAAPLVSCAHAKRPYVTTCPPPRAVFVIGDKRIAASHCSDEYIAQPTETVHVGQRIEVVTRAGEAMPFSDDQRVLREVSRTRDRRTAAFQALRPGHAGLDLHYGPPCPDSEGTGESTAPRHPGTNLCVLLPIRVIG